MKQKDLSYEERRRLFETLSAPLRAELAQRTAAEVAFDDRVLEELKRGKSFEVALRKANQDVPRPPSRAGPPSTVRRCSDRPALAPLARPPPSAARTQRLRTCRPPRRARAPAAESRAGQPLRAPSRVCPTCHAPPPCNHYLA